MPKLLPIRSLRYASTGDVGSRIAPPYDVLDEEPKRRLLARDPHNIVAIDLPVTPPKTVGPDSAYEAAGELFKRWRSEGVLKADGEPCLFAYEQEFEVEGQTRRRRGLFAGLGVEGFNRAGGGIFRHEHTIRGGTDDRLKLMKATRAQLSPIFGFFEDPAQAVAGLLAETYRRAPDVTGTTPHDNVRHKIWAVRDTATVERLAEFFEPTDVFIADGHHRYNTSLNYLAENPGSNGAKSCLFVLVAAQDPGLKVLATHRVLCGLRGFTIERLSKLLHDDRRWAIKPSPHGPDNLHALAAALPTSGPHAVGLYDPATRKCLTAHTPAADPLATELPDQPKVWRELDVAVFHELLVDRILRPHFGGTSITYKYPHDLAELVRLCDESPDRLGVVMQPTPLESVREVSLAHGVMPPKSTFFYPKLATGLVINPLD